VAETYRSLRTSVEFAFLDVPVRTLLVTSALAGEGKTVTAANLAVVFAQAGRRVLLLDADLRKPGVHLMFGLSNAQGLTTLMRGDGPAVGAVVQATEQDNLHVLPAGPLPPNPAELLGSQRMRAVLESLKAGCDIVIVDSPPVQVVTDATILSSLMDGCVFVIDATRSRRRAVHHAREALDRAGAHMLGVVLNRVPAEARADYGGYYGDAYAPDAAPGSAKLDGGRSGPSERPAL
jgi:capsular exopolysaccharide synthesis family protein